MTAMQLSVSTPVLLAVAAVLGLLLLLLRQRRAGASMPAPDPAWAKPAPGARRVTQLFVFPVKCVCSFLVLFRSRIRAACVAWPAHRWLAPTAPGVSHPHPQHGATLPMC
jgi:hypothetical protein